MLNNLKDNKLLFQKSQMFLMQEACFMEGSHRLQFKHKIWEDAKVVIA